MNPMRKATIGMLMLLALLAFFPCVVRAQEGPPPPPEMALNPALLEDAQKETGITDDQIKAIKEILYKHHREAIRLHADIRIAELDLRYALDQEKPNREKIMKMVEDLGALRTKLEKAKIDMHLKLKEIIKPEQEKKLRKFMRSKFESRRETFREKVKARKAGKERAKKQ
jgi:Spy/CpxP family protein refolding chaperone